MRRVVITGLGVVTATGCTIADFFAQLLEGRAGTRRIQNLEPALAEQLNCKIAAEVLCFDPSQHFGAKELDQLDRFSQFAVVAAKQALEDAGRGEFSEEEQNRLGVCVGTAYGGTETLESTYVSLYGKNASRLSPLVLPRLMYNAAACQVSMRFRARGPTLAPSTACSSGSHAIGEAMRFIQHGQADWMLAGGSDAPITYGVIRAWEAMRVLAPENGDAARACRPFSADRRGIVIGEGAAVLLLEEYEVARKRGARIYAELAGYGANSDASHITQPSVEGPARAMQLALDDAGLNPDEVDYINAHGTATRVNDVVE
ncbi:MAG: beta-ketoacyl synthase, partial [Candidatus Acidiferrales bacterium]